MKKLSVIIPAYQAELTISKCIESILRNTVELEVLVVDDGSRDRTGDIISQIAKNDIRVRTWTSANAGPGAAREFAMKHARGEYVTFVDADDYIETGFYDAIAEKLDGHLDILEFGFVKETQEASLLSEHRMGVNACKGKACGLYYAQQKNTTNFLWNKVFRKKMLQKVVFPHLFQSEDAAVLAQAFVFSKIYQSIDEIGYHYVMTRDSLCRKPFSIARLDSLKAYNFIDDFYSEYAPELCVYSRHKLCSLSVLLYCQCFNFANEYRTYCAGLLTVYRKNRLCFSLPQLLSMGSRSRRIMLMLFEISPRLCACVYSWRLTR